MPKIKCIRKDGVPGSKRYGFPDGLKAHETLEVTEDQWNDLRKCNAFLVERKGKFVVETDAEGLSKIELDEVTGLAK